MKTLKHSLETLQQTAKERTVKTQTIEYDLETLVKKIERRVIKLNPDYQRNHRWDNATSSRLIESLVLNIPIPIIYISQDVDVDEETEEGTYRYSVIDGQQRLTAIYEYFKNQYALIGLEVLEELNGSFYNDLPPFLIRRLEERTIRCLRIDSTVDPQVKYDIFERLNSGSVKLEPQELRNATCRGPFKDLIKDLAKNNEDFKKMARLTKTSKKVEKMEDQELVLRFFAFAYEDRYLKYNGSMKSFLTSSMEYFNSLSIIKIEEMKKQFTSVMQNIRQSFGDKAFSKYKYSEEEGLSLMSNFNAAVFDSVVVPFYKLQIENKKCHLTYEQFQNIFKDVDYFDSIQGSIHDVSKLQKRINKGMQFIQ